MDKEFLKFFQSEESDTYWAELDKQEAPFPTVNRGEVISIVCGLRCLQSDINKIQQQWNVDFSEGVQEIDTLIRRIKSCLHPNEKEE